MSTQPNSGPCDVLASDTKIGATVQSSLDAVAQNMGDMANKGYMKTPEVGASFNDYHFMRGMRSVSIPAISRQVIFQHTEICYVKQGLSNFSFPITNVGSEYKDLLGQIENDLDTCGKLNSVVLKSDQPWHYIVFQFDEYIVLVIARCPPKDPVNNEGLLQELLINVPEHKIFRFIHAVDEKMQIIVQCYKIVIMHNKNTTTTSYHRVL